MKKRAGSSLSGRISALIIVMIVISMTIIGVISYSLYRLDSISLGADKALAVAQTVASSIDPVRFNEIMETGEKDEYWNSVKSFADDVKTRNGLMYLYILDKNYGDNVVYFVEGSAPGDDEPCDLWEEEEVEAHADEVFVTIDTGLPTTTDIYESEGYGMMVSGFAPVLDGNNNVVGLVGVDISMDDVLESSNFFGMLTLIFVVFFSAVFGIISRRYITRHVREPISALSEASGKIAKGDMAVELTSRSNDEIGRLTEAFREMVNSTNSQIAILERLSEGDLTAEIEPRSERDSMGFALKKTLENLNHMFADINGSTINVSTGAAQIASAAQSLANGAVEQSVTVEKLEAEISDVAAKTKENAGMAGKAASLAVDIKNSAEKGSAQMERMIRAVDEINEASKSIGKVIKTIDDIAFQTNILALNASVEAARAGQHGKGFAVVAEEVRNLASKSAEASKNTGTLITDSMEKAELGAHIAGETAESLNEIVSGINESSRIMSSIASSSDEQSEFIAKINSDIDQVARIVTQNSSMAEESSASSEELSSESAMLRELVSKFKLKNDDRI